jgi:hypothetical protein
MSDKRTGKKPKRVKAAAPSVKTAAAGGATTLQRKPAREGAGR